MKLKWRLKHLDLHALLSFLFSHRTMFCAYDSRIIISSPVWSNPIFFFENRFVNTKWYIVIKEREDSKSAFISNKRYYFITLCCLHFFIWALAWSNVNFRKHRRQWRTIINMEINRIGFYPSTVKTKEYISFLSMRENVNAKTFYT